MSNFSVMEVPNGVPVFMWNKGVQIEEEAIKQLTGLAQMPFVYKHVAAMPDSHYGIGAPVGSVFASIGAVIPASVGVDIGCGMIAAKTNITRRDIELRSDEINSKPKYILATVRAAIEKAVPMGRTNNGGPGDIGAWANLPDDIKQAWDEKLAPGYESELHKDLQKGNSSNHLGTLGTGNHFIEVQLEVNHATGAYNEDSPVWIMLHSGSRGPGNRIGSYFIKKAKALMEQFYIKLPDKDLAYFPEGTQGYADYSRALHWAQKFAYINRQIMLQRTLAAINSVVPGVTIEREINTHHNYATVEKHFGKQVLLTRKGAINAAKDVAGIIPGSMGTRSYIVNGLGNPLSFNSCSHGAGRAMSRTEARKRFTVADHEAATSGVECRKDAEVVDETPAAYKDIDSVIEAEKDLVTPVVTLKQLLCCKG